MYKKLLRLIVSLCTFVPFCVARYNPEVSVIVTIYNKEHQIDKVINGILECTKSPFELILVFDGCTDKSEEITKSILATNKGTIERLVMLHTPDVNETKANNAGMKAALGRYFILVQDDMQIIEEGWEQRLIKPMKVFDDVFAVSALWAGSYAPFTQDSSKHQYSEQCTGIARDTFAIRDVICRGPVALDAAVVKKLNYLDEAYAPLYLDDHDICVRAYRDFKKVCGIYKVRWKSLKKTCRGDQKMSNGQYFGDVIKKNRKLFWKRYHDYFNKKGHSETRPLP